VSTVVVCLIEQFHFLFEFLDGETKNEKVEKVFISQLIKLSLKIGQQTIQSIEPLDPWTDIWREDYMAGIFLPPSKLSPSSICTFFLCNFRVPFPQLGKRMLLDILHPCLVVLLVSILICINSTLTLEGINTLTQIINKV
jgi:hypothetical protein